MKKKNRFLSLTRCMCLLKTILSSLPLYYMLVFLMQRVSPELYHQLKDDLCGMEFQMDRSFTRFLGMLLLEQKAKVVWVWCLCKEKIKQCYSSDYWDWEIIIARFLDAKEFNPSRSSLVSNM